MACRSAPIKYGEAYEAENKRYHRGAAAGAALHVGALRRHQLHQNFPLDAWAWGPAVAGLAALLYWVRRQRTAKPRCAELVLSIVFGVAEVLGLSICKLGSWAFVFKNPYQVFVGAVCMAGYGVLFYHAVWGLYALLGRHGCPGWPCSGPGRWIGTPGGRSPKSSASRR